MAYTAVNFKPTSHTSRYIKEIRQYWLQKIEDGVPRYEIKNQDWLEVETALPHEKISSAETKNVGKFLNWLEKNHAIEFKDDYSSVLNISDATSDEDVVPAKLYIRVRDIEPLEYLENDFSSDDKKGAKKELGAVRFEGNKLSVGGTQKHSFQENAKNKSYSPAKIFSLLWEHRQHITSEDINVNPGLAKKVSVGQIEVMVNPDVDDTSEALFLQEIQSNIAKLHKKVKAISLSVERTEKGEVLLQLVVDERS